MIISRYLSREVLQAFLAVTLILLLAFLSQQVVRYLSYVAIGKIPTNVLLELVSFELPYLLALLLPLGFYIAILLAYGRLYADHEMAILQLAGFGRRQLLQLTLWMGMLIMLIVLFLMLWVNPWVSTKRQQVMESDEATLHLVETLMPGRFQASPDGAYVMYVEKLSRDRARAENVFLAQQKKNLTEAEQNTWMLVLANQGYQIKDKLSRDQFFVTENGYRYEGVPGQNNYKIIQFKKYAVRIPQNDMRMTHQEVETLATLQLLQDYANPKRAAELQWRFSIPLSVILLACLAVLLSAVQSRQSRYLVLLPAMLIYIIYMNLLFIARHWVEQGTMFPLLGIWWVHGIALLLIVMILLARVRN